MRHRAPGFLPLFKFYIYSPSRPPTPFWLSVTLFFPSLLPGCAADNLLQKPPSRPFLGFSPAINFRAKELAVCPRQHLHGRGGRQPDVWRFLRPRALLDLWILCCLQVRTVWIRVMSRLRRLVKRLLTDPSTASSPLPPPLPSPGGRSHNNADGR